MRILTSYIAMEKMWSAVMHDEIGSVGCAEFGKTEVEAAFRLGAEFGRNPSSFARPLGELLRIDE